MLCRLCFCALTALSTVILVSPAQETSKQGVPGISPRVWSWISIVDIPPVPEIPFRATAVIDGTETLVDGSTVPRTTRAAIARDSKGRTYNENRYAIEPSESEGRIRDITIIDPIAHTRTTLMPATRTATIAIQPAPQAASQLQYHIEREDLGTSSIDGLSVQVSRVTKTMADAGANNPWLPSMDEYWYSDDLQMNIRRKHTDPTHGTEMYTLTDVSRDEPDAKLFEFPPGYSVRDRRETR